MTCKYCGQRKEGAGGVCSECQKIKDVLIETWGRLNLGYLPLYDSKIISDDDLIVVLMSVEYDFLQAEIYYPWTQLPKTAKKKMVLEVLIEYEKERKA